MRAALKGYALLKLVGKNLCLDALRKTIGAGFLKSPRQTTETAVT